MAIEALSDGGVRMGLAREVSTHLAARTMAGAARLVTETGLDLKQLHQNVDVSSEVTKAGLSQLEQGGFRTTLHRAIQAAATKSEELGQI